MTIQEQLAQARREVVAWARTSGTDDKTIDKISTKFQQMINLANEIDNLLAEE